MRRGRRVDDDTAGRTRKDVACLVVIFRLDAKRREDLKSDLDNIMAVTGGARRII
jgi:hypothetical protein